MSKRMRILWGAAAATVSIATGIAIGTAAGQTTASVPKPQDRVAIGQADVRALVLLMDTDRNGRISKQEFMKFMEAEFDRLDRDGDGQLDPPELAQMELRGSHFLDVGK